MVQVDLITGFLGAGKTTFLRRYVRYLVQQGHKVCILENDFGAVNVDAMLVQEVLGPGCDVETISGGCDCDTHQRRMRTKLIAMAMRGFDRRARGATSPCGAPCSSEARTRPSAPRSGCAPDTAGTVSSCPSDTRRHRCG